MGFAAVMLHLPENLLTHEEQRFLATIAATVDAAATLVRLSPTAPTLPRTLGLGLAAQRILWERNLRLVMRLALDAQRRTGSDLDELFQEGCLALYDAIRGFRPELGYRLVTYAHDSIVRRLNTVDTTSDWISTSRHHRRMRLHAVADGTRGTTNLTFARNVGPDALESLVDPRNPFEEIDEPSVEFLDLIEPKLGSLLRMRYGIDGTEWPQEAAAEHFGVSTSTISRWERRALEQARRLLLADQTTTRVAAGVSDRSHRRRQHRSLSGPPSPSRTPRRLVPWR